MTISERTFDIQDSTDGGIGLNKIEGKTFQCWIEKEDSVGRSIQMFVTLSETEKKELKLWEFDKEEGSILANERSCQVFFTLFAG